VQTEFLLSGRDRSAESLNESAAGLFASFTRVEERDLVAGERPAVDGPLRDAEGSSTIRLLPLRCDECGTVAPLELRSSSRSSRREALHADVIAKRLRAMNGVPTRRAPVPGRRERDRGELGDGLEPCQRRERGARHVARDQRERAPAGRERDHRRQRVA
jgi:hypothetical protein